MFDGKSKKFELFEELFKNKIKIGHFYVSTNRCRGHQLYRRQKDLVTTSKTTKRGYPFSLPTTTYRTYNEDVAECQQRQPYDLNVIKEFIQHDKHDDYIPLMSAIMLKKRKMMLLIPLCFQEVEINVLVDSGAYIKVISERDAEKTQKEANASIIEKAPSTLSKYNTPTSKLRTPLPHTR